FNPFREFPRAENKESCGQRIQRACVPDFHFQGLYGVPYFADHVKARPPERFIHQQYFSFYEVKFLHHTICKPCPLSSKAIIMPPTTMRYHPNALKPYFDTTPMNDLMAIMATKKPTTFPMIN